METQRDVIKSFLNKEKAQIDFLKSTGNKLISYGTCIAEWLDEPVNITEGDMYIHGKYDLVINSTMYSAESSTHLVLLFSIMNLLNNNKPMYLRVSNIPKGTQKLWKN